MYTETRAKIDIDYRPDEDRAAYNQTSFFEFDAEASQGDEWDYVMVPNIPLVVSIVSSFFPLLAKGLFHEVVVGR